MSNESRFTPRSPEAASSQRDALLWLAKACFSITYAAAIEVASVARLLPLPASAVLLFL